MTDLVTLEGWLLEAKTARHKLAIGRSTVSASYDGKSVSYTQADAFKLDAYIADLERQIGDLKGAARRRGPVQFVF